MSAMASTQTSRVTRAGTDKRQPQILRTAAQLFQRKGYHATSMDEVASALKLNKATIYHHFPGGKSDLLYGIALGALQDLAARADALGDDHDPEQRLRGLLRAMIAVQLERPDETVVYHEELRWMKGLLSAAQFRELRKLETDFHQLVVDTVAAGVRSGAFHECEAPVVATLVINLASSAYRTFRPGRRPDGEKLTERYAAFVLDGLRER
jgi:AcrR family transcriptional regulator